jgi:predicted ester cyclase
MKGFDTKFSDFTDYILGITKEIWEDRGISTLDNYYAEDIIVRSPTSIVVGNKSVIGATMATLAEFPDRRLLGEDVIWSGNPEKGMLSSHRILSTATHSGNGIYGEATGKKVIYRVIADCHAISNKINDEWLVRDQGAIVRQLGKCPEEYTRSLILAEGGPEKCLKPFSPEDDIKGPYKEMGNSDKWGVKYAAVLSDIMKSDFISIRKNYDRALVAEMPGGRTCYSYDGIDEFWMGLRSSFPDAKFEVHHTIGLDEKMLSPRSAIRWSLSGKHDGLGAFGKPTGADVYIMGISHAEFGPRGIRREFTVLDEVAIWKQILLHKGEI